MFISKIKVTNFRSLVNVEVSLQNYTTLVGLNDSGKSNLLRALNLFFNNQTDHEQELNFEKDYSQQARVIPKKAKQIEIELELTPPKSYKSSGKVIWKKIYRADSQYPVIDIVSRKGGGEFGRNSKINYWVRHIAYEYVPAIRGRHYFVILKRRLYTTLAATVAPKLNDASRTFLLDLREEVKKIESESERLLQLKTEFILPSDLGKLFEVLDFDATDTHTKTTLQYRGDGIQGRHIPIVLKFLADQRKSLSAKGKPVPETIWGFEEPENNLELIKQIDTANEFERNSKTIQILLSTHSPAFYGVGKKSNSIRVAVRKDGATNFEEGFPSELIDENLGLMPFIEPYLSAAISNREILIAEINQLKSEILIKNKPILYVEGTTDKTILEAAFSCLGISKNFEIHCKDKLGGGANWVKGYCLARAAMADVREKTGALLDDDDAGRSAVAEINKHIEQFGKSNKIKLFLVGRKSYHDEIRALKKASFKIPLGIEELCSKDVWDYAEDKGWLIEREGIQKANIDLMDSDKSLNQVIEETFKELHIKRLIKLKINPIHKSKFAKRFSSTLTADTISKSLVELIHEINTHFS